MSDALDRLCNASFVIDPAWMGDMRVLLPQNLCAPMPEVVAVRRPLDRLDSPPACALHLIVSLPVVYVYVQAYPSVSVPVPVPALLPG